jgi:LmbE family N-acetylglucosaminyl deacetylase
MTDALRVLTIFPHPDDATLHAAGTLARWVAEGHQVTAVCCTSGNLGTMRIDQTQEQIAEIRTAELMAANRILGIQQTEVLGFPDGGLMDAAELRRTLIHCVRRYRPDRVMTLDPWTAYEVHPDHVLVGRMAAEAAAFAAFPLLHPEQISEDVQPQPVSEVWFMGILGHEPNYFVDISTTMDQKVEAMLKFEATLALLAGLFEQDIDPADVSAEELQVLTRHADKWLRSIAAEVGRKAGLATAEAFFVQKCLPGHFDNMHQAMSEMLGDPVEPPTVI